MEVKDLIGLTLILTGLPLGIVACCFSQRVRDAAFMFLVAGTVLTERLDINFVSRYWYRGTTRGFEFTVLDLLALSLLISTLLLSRPGRPRIFWPASLGAMLLYLGYACFSVAISDPKLFGLFELSKIIRGITVFLAAAFFVRGERELKLLVFALCCAVCFEGLLSIKQRLLDGIYRVTGSVDHANSLSMYLCLSGPVLVAAAASDLPKSLRYFSMLCFSLASVAILLTISRAGIPIFGLATLGAAACCVSWRISAKKLAVAAFISLVVVGLLFKSWGTLQARFAQSTLEDEYFGDQYESRGMYLRQAKAIVADRPFGVGLNNWSYWVSKTYGAELGLTYEDYDGIDYAPNKEILSSFLYAAPAHNLGALTIGELGVPGLVVFVLLWLRWFHLGAGFLRMRPRDTQRQMAVGIFFGICGVFLQSLTEWVYRQTQIMLTFHILLGVMAGLHFLARRARQDQRRLVALSPENAAQCAPA